jgi:hypothetical protein
VTLHPGEVLDHGADAVQAPRLTNEPVGRGGLQQGLLDPRKLRHPTAVASGRSAPAVPRVDAAGLEAGMPDAHGLRGDLELAGDLGLAHADSEQLSSRPARRTGRRGLGQAGASRSSCTP